VRKKNLVQGEEYGISVEGVPMRAKLLRIGEYEHSMEITVAPERQPRRRYGWSRPEMYQIGARIDVTSVSIKYPMTIVIKEEEDELAWA
jgi:hypothetical protein